MILLNSRRRERLLTSGLSALVIVPEEDKDRYLPTVSPLHGLVPPVEPNTFDGPNIPSYSREDREALAALGRHPHLWQALHRHPHSHSLSHEQRRYLSQRRREVHAAWMASGQL